ncbi:MAG TPA: hypothetical protein H9815_17900 [Candidatus Ruania gallistercoris]|uniref:Uncharacterized protein n=1 Tax=Candidatus Ruania gallistercoris TaxID=2838746 RepID=A0A9D2EHP4_9MICO|nr:hypothetical protein [Candidatus Ruania gallistercoris]
MHHRLATVLLAGALAGLVAGCADGSDPEDAPTTLQPTDTGPESTEPPDQPTDSPAPTDDATDPPGDVQEAVADLADRLGVPVADIDAGPLEAVTWPDGSLGCPQPGSSYPQVLTDGYRVMLTTDGDEYAYHAGEDGELTYCADPVDPVSGDTEAS